MRPAVYVNIYLTVTSHFSVHGMSQIHRVTEGIVSVITGKLVFWVCDLLSVTVLLASFLMHISE